MVDQGVTCKLRPVLVSASPVSSFFVSVCLWSLNMIKLVLIVFLFNGTFLASLVAGHASGDSVLLTLLGDIGEVLESNLADNVAGDRLNAENNGLPDMHGEESRIEKIDSKDTESKNNLDFFSGGLNVPSREPPLHHDLSATSEKESGPFESLGGHGDGVDSASDDFKSKTFDESLDLPSDKGSDDDNLEMLVDDFVGKSIDLGDNFRSKIQEEVIIKNTGETPLDKEKQAWIGYQNVFQIFTNTILDRITPDLTQMAMKSSVSSSCMLSLAAMLTAIREQKSWAIKMIDSTGRPFSSGFLDGTITDFGSFDQCLDIKYQPSPTRPIEQAQYCMVQYNVILPPKPPYLTLQTKLFDFTNTSVDGTIFEEISDLLNACYDRAGRVGICIPSSCSKADAQNIISYLLGSGHLQANVTHCEIKMPLTLSTLQTVIAYTFTILVIIAIIGSIIDAILYHKDYKLVGFYKTSADRLKSHLIQIFLAFSLQSNIKSLLDTNKKPGPLDAINGIRVISMGWIIWTHTYLIPIKETFAFARNYIHAVEGFLFQFILNGWVLVDSFFCIGAMLAVYGHLNSMKKSGQINPLEIMVNRICRFSPSVCFTVALLFLIPALSNGPLWSEYFSYQISKCNNYWWATVFFFNNWFPEAKICMLHTWYLSADIQLYLFSIIFLIPLYK